MHVGLSSASLTLRVGENVGALPAGRSPIAGWESSGAYFDLKLY